MAATLARTGNIVPVYETFDSKNIVIFLVRFLETNEDAIALLDPPDPQERVKIMSKQSIQKWFQDNPDADALYPHLEKQFSKLLSDADNEYLYIIRNVPIQLSWVIERKGCGISFFSTNQLESHTPDNVTFDHYLIFMNGPGIAPHRIAWPNFKF